MVTGRGPTRHRAEPFVVRLPDELLAELQTRLLRARLPLDFANDDWRYGTNGDYLRGLLDYWANGFDWRKQEREINSFSHYRTMIDDVPIHFIHESGKGPRPIPLILTHGWPWTFWDYRKIIRPLSDPAAFNGNPADAFDVIVPSLPGFAFSTPLTISGINWWRTADLWVTLMQDVLGYERFGAQGGDWGATVSAQLGHKYADRVIGIHLTSVPALDNWAVERPWERSVPPSLSGDSRADYIAWQRKFIGHMAVQVIAPQTIGYAMHDSPAGLCAWLLERRRAWSDCNGDVERRFTRDELLTQMTLYWATDSFTSAARFYAEAANLPWQPSHERSPVVEAPTGVTVFRPDVPKSWSWESLRNRSYNVHFHKERASGGHFAPAEEPDALVEDIRATFRPLRER